MDVGVRQYRARRIQRDAEKVLNYLSDISRFPVRDVLLNLGDLYQLSRVEALSLVVLVENRQWDNDISFYNNAYQINYPEFVAKDSQLLKVFFYFWLHVHSIKVCYWDKSEPRNHNQPVKPLQPTYPTIYNLNLVDLVKTQEEVESGKGPCYNKDSFGENQETFLKQTSLNIYPNFMFRRNNQSFLDFLTRNNKNPPQNKSYLKNFKSFLQYCGDKLSSKLLTDPFTHFHQYPLFLSKHDLTSYRKFLNLYAEWPCNNSGWQPTKSFKNLNQLSCCVERHFLFHRSSNNSLVDSILVIAPTKSINEKCLPKSIIRPVPIITPLIKPRKPEGPIRTKPPQQPDNKGDLDNIIQPKLVTQYGDQPGQNDQVSNLSGLLNSQQQICPNDPDDRPRVKMDILPSQDPIRLGPTVRGDSQRYNDDHIKIESSGINRSQQFNDD